MAAVTDVQRLQARVEELERWVYGSGGSRSSRKVSDLGSTGPFLEQSKSGLLAWSLGWVLPLQSVWSTSRSVSDSQAPFPWRALRFFRLN